MQPVSDEIRIRAAITADAAALADIYASFVLANYSSFEEVPPTADEMAQRMQHAPRLPWLVAETAGDVVGFAYAGPHHQRSAYRWAADSSVYLRNSAVGRGVGTALYQHLIPLVRDHGYVSLFAGIALPNEASVRLHESFGFRRIGTFPASGFKLGAWRDVGWWSLPLRDPPDQPDEPRQWDGQL